MADANQQPTILVKKPDGSMVRMTMDEVKAMQTSKPTPPPAPVSAPTKTVRVQPVQKVVVPENKPAPTLSTPPSKPQSVPMRTEEKRPLPSTTAPVKEIFKDEAKASMQKPLVSVEKKMPLPPLPLAPQRDVEYSFPAMPQKSVMRDVAPPPRRVSVGPIDELRSFALADFRRLAPAAASAASKLIEKFSNLRNESFLLYVDAAQAWKESPLFQQYLGYIERSMNEKKPIQDLVGMDGSKTELSLQELKELIKVNATVTI